MNRIALVGLCCVLFLAGTAVPVRAVTDEQVGEAIHNMQQWLLRQYTDTGMIRGEYPPDDPRHYAGRTALATYALLHSGISPQNPTVAKALRFLREADIGGTYVVSLRAHCWGQLPDSYLPMLRADANWLIHAQKGFTFHYGPAKSPKDYDLSTSQYGFLGLWEYNKRGGQIPKAFWEGTTKRFLELEEPDGGWSYHSPRASTGSMTAAGLTVLYICQQQLGRAWDKPPAKLTAALDRGMAWLDQNFSPSKNPGGGPLYYYLYGVERVGMCSGVKFLNKQDWFASAANVIVNHAKSGHVGSSVQTAFSLLFLTRGRVPVWAVKLKLPGQDWNNHPNDLYFLTHYLSDLNEQEINWQYVSVDRDATDWLPAPIAWLSSDQAVNLTKKQTANLKSYLDLGGLLITNPEHASQSFNESIRRLAKQLYPDYKFDTLPANSPYISLLYDTSHTTGRQVRALSNGDRVLMLMLPGDWGKRFQADEPPGKTSQWKTISDIYATATSRGDIRTRLDKVIQPRDKKQKSNGTIHVVRAQYTGDWDAERRAWEPLRNRMFNRTGYDFDITTAPLASIADSKANLVYLAGVKAVHLSDAEVAAIKAYAEHGGTVLIETLGGKGEFATAVQQQLAPALKQVVAPMIGDNPILTGKGLPNGYDTSRALFRPYSIVSNRFANRVLLGTILVGDRPAIISSQQDLSLGVLGVQHWGINGYQTRYARQLLTNILLSTKSK